MLNYYFLKYSELFIILLKIIFEKSFSEINWFFDFALSLKLYFKRTNSLIFPKFILNKILILLGLNESCYFLDNNSFSCRTRL